MIFDAIQEWFQELLIDGIISNLTGMFDTLNTKVGEIAGEVGMTPSAWNSGIFNMVRSLSETVIVPIASIVLTFVMCYELIQLIVEKNNLHDFDTWIFFKWMSMSRLGFPVRCWGWREGLGLPAIRAVRASSA